MGIIVIVCVLVFSTVLCMIEVPKMLKNREYKELCTFSILLAIGTILTILKSLNVEIPNPSDFIEWVYSPTKESMEVLFK